MIRTLLRNHLKLVAEQFLFLKKIKDCLTFAIPADFGIVVVLFGRILGVDLDGTLKEYSLTHSTKWLDLHLN